MADPHQQQPQPAGLADAVRPGLALAGDEAPLLRHLAQEGRSLQAKYARKNREFGEDW